MTLETKDLPSPAISVIVPDCDSIDGVGPCLEGFAAQTLARDQFELILTGRQIAEQQDSLRSLYGRQIQLVFTATEAGDLSARRNASIRKARAPLVTLYSSDLRPFPDLLDYCLSFHAAHPAVHHACLLGFAIDPTGRHLHPSGAGVQSWQAFQSEAITCKTALFRHGQFDSAYGCMAGPEFALRLFRRVDLTLFYEPIATGVREIASGLRAACETHYETAYYEYLLARAYPGAVSHVVSELIDGHEQLASMMATIRSLESNPAEPWSPRSRILAALYSRIQEHARAEGWAAAERSEAPNPPGILASLFK